MYTHPVIYIYKFKSTLAGLQKGNSRLLTANYLITSTGGGNEIIYMSQRE